MESIDLASLFQCKHLVLCLREIDTPQKPPPPTFSQCTIDLFIDELVNLLNHFIIQDGFDLATSSHSWGDGHPEALDH